MKGTLNMLNKLKDMIKKVLGIKYYSINAGCPSRILRRLNDK